MTGTGATLSGKSIGEDESAMAPGDDPAGAAERLYDVRVDPARQCLHVMMRGRWSHDVFDAFAGELRAAEAGMRAFEGTTYALTEGSRFDIQDPSIVERFPALLESFALDERRRSAVVVGSSPLARMQARPTGAVVNARHFRTVEDAEAWLFSSEA